MVFDTGGASPITGPTVYYGMNGPGERGGRSPGDVVRIALQVDTGTLADGRYDYTVEVVAHSTGGDQTQDFYGSLNLVNRAASAAGSDWSVRGNDRLSLSDAGAMLVFGNDATEWFARQDDGTFATPAGGFDVLAYDSGSGQYTYSDPQQDREVFDSTGQLVESLDANGNATTYGYTDGLLTSITDPLGQVTSYAYTGGLLVSTTDPAGRTTTYAYDTETINGSSVNLLSSITEPAASGSGSGAETQFFYDSQGRMTESINGNNGVLHYGYDFAGRLHPTTYPNGGVVTLTAQEVRGPGRPEPLTPPAGYDASHLAPLYLSSEVGAVETDELGNATTTISDAAGDVLSTTNALGQTTTYKYGANGLVSETDAPNPDGGSAAGHHLPVRFRRKPYRGNLPGQQHRTWRYDPTWNVMTQHVDQMGRMTNYRSTPTATSPR